MATMKKTTAKPKLKKAQAGGYNDTSGKKKIGPALGIGVPVAGMVAAGANMIKNAVKRRKEKKATEEETRKALENAKMRKAKKSQIPAPFDKRKAEKARRAIAKTGGTAKYKMGGIKKYQPGGSAEDPEYAAWKAQKAAEANNKKMTEFTPGQKGTFGTGMAKMPYDLWQMTAKSPANQHAQKYPGTSNKFYEKRDGEYMQSMDPNDSFGYPTSDDQADWQNAYRNQENFNSTLPAALRGAMGIQKRGGATKAKYKKGGLVKAQDGKVTRTKEKSSSFTGTGPSSNLYYKEKEKRKNVFRPESTVETVRIKRTPYEHVGVNKWKKAGPTTVTKSSSTETADSYTQGPTTTRRAIFAIGKRSHKTGGAAKATYKTGGMVNPNAIVSKQTKPGSKGVTPRVNPKATAAKRATGRVGGTSTAPKGAIPKAQMGGSKTPYMKPASIDSTLTKKDVKRVIKTVKKRKN